MSQWRSSSHVCVALFVWMCVAAAPVMAADSAVETLIKAMPDDAIVFVATGGGDAVKGDFDKSIIGRLWNDPGVQSLYQSVRTSLEAKMQQEAGDPNGVKEIEKVLDLLQMATSRPLVIGLAPVKGPVEKDMPPFYGFAILDAGARKAEFDAALKSVETMAGADRIADVSVGSTKMRGPKGMPELFYWGWSGNDLVAAFNDGGGAAMQRLQKPQTTLPAYLKKVPSGGDVFVFHADIQKAIGMVDSFTRVTNAAEEGRTIMAVLKDLGVSSVKTFTARAGFAGPEIVTGSFLEAPQPRTGLLAAMKPMDPGLMEMVDARAVTAGAASFDAAGVYDTIMRAIKTASVAAYGDVEKGLAAFESQAKLSIRKDLLGSLAGPVVFYTLGPGSTPETPMGGVVVLVKLKDAKLFETALAGLGDYAAAQSKGMFQTGSQTRDDGRTVHSWIIPQAAMMQVMPTWSVANEYAVIGSNTASHDLVVRQMTAAAGDRQSITGTAGYKETASRLPGNLVSLSYADSRTQYTQTMAMLGQMWPMANMFAMQAGIKLPPALPSLDSIIKDMKPSCRSGWTDSDGFYSQYRGPGVDVSLKSVAGTSLAMGVLMPALARVRQLSFRMTSGTNLSGIGKACLIFANDHGDKMPPDLQALVKEVELSPQALESKLKPKDSDGPSYIYIAGQNVSMHPGNIVAYDNPEFCIDGVNVLFLDSHVEFVKPQEFRRRLAETCKRLGREIPEIKFKGE